MDTLNTTLALLVLVGAFLGALNKVLKEWSEIRSLLFDWNKQGKRKKDGSTRRKR